MGREWGWGGDGVAEGMGVTDNTDHMDKMHTHGPHHITARAVILMHPPTLAHRSLSHLPQESIKGRILPSLCVCTSFLRSVLVSHSPSVHNYSARCASCYCTLGHFYASLHSQNSS